MTLAGAYLGVVEGLGFLDVSGDYIIPFAVIGCGLGLLIGMVLDTFLPRKKTISN
jgi:hypothetical protein